MRDLVTHPDEVWGRGGGIAERGLSLSEVKALLNAGSHEHEAILERGDIVYVPGDAVLAAAIAGLNAFAQSNTVYREQFPALSRFHDDLIATAATMFHGRAGTVGTVTTGGTESILLTIKAARDRARALKPHVAHPKMVAPVSAHPAFARGAAYFDVELVTTPLNDDWTVDVEAYARSLTDDVVLMTASAPSLPTGLVEPIHELAPLAAERDIPFHVDACLGGYFLPFAEELGRASMPDFRIDGVTTISADLHKFGYASIKGTSVLIHRDRGTYQYQPFYAPAQGRDITYYATSGMVGSRSGAPLAAAWAVMTLLGKDGYRQRTAETLEFMDILVTGIESIEDLHVPVKPAVPLIAFASRRRDEIFSVAHGMQQAGWLARPDTWPADLIRGVWPWGLRPYVATFLEDLHNVCERVRNGQITHAAAPTY